MGIIEDIKIFLAMFTALLLAIIISHTVVNFCFPKKKPEPKTVIIKKSSPVKYHYKGKYELTWYCQGTKTASGNKVNHNLTAAADINSGLKFNDVVYIETLGQPVVIHDTGSAVKGNKLDIYINDCDQAIQNGRKTSNVYLIGG